jgi:hypothetical protein
MHLVFGSTKREYFLRSAKISLNLDKLSVLVYKNPLIHRNNSSLDNSYFLSHFEFLSDPFSKSTPKIFRLAPEVLVPS